MNKSLVIIGKSEYLPIIQDLGFGYQEFSDENRLKLLSSLKKPDDLAVAACCITDSCLETIISQRHEIARHGLEVFVLNLDDGCKTFEDLEKLATSVIAGIIAVTPLPVVKDFKLLEQSILSSPPKVLFEENNRLPKERKYFVPRDQRSSKSVYSCQKHFPRRIMRRGIGSKIGPIFFNKVPGNLTKKYFGLIYILLIFIFYEFCYYMKNQIEKTKIDLGEAVEKGGLFAKMKDKFFLVPKNVRLISLSVFIFMLGWGIGGDTFYSVFIESIVENVFRVSLIGAVLPLVKLFVAPSVGELNDDSDKKHVFLFSKFLYIVSSVFYVLAGLLKNPWLLLIAVVINGLGSSATFVTYYSAVRENCNKNHSEASRGLFLTGFNGAYVVGALISAAVISYIHLPYLYVFIAIFSILSLFIDWKIPFHESKEKEVSENHFEFVKKFCRKCCSIQPMKKMIVSLKQSSRTLWNGLGYEMLYALLDYLSLLFIPLVALEHGLSLGQIALVFAMMRLPYIFNLFVSGVDEGKNKKLFIAVILVFLAGLFVLLGFNLSFPMILIVSFCIAFGLSVMKPVVSAMITEHTHKDNIGLISGAEQFATFLGNIAGAIGFGVLSSIFTMDIAFFIVGLSLAVLAGLSFFKRGKEKVKRLKGKNNF